MNRHANSRPPLILTDHMYRSNFYGRFAVVVFHERGICYVVDERDESMLTFTQFRRRFGTLGAQFLARDDKRVYLLVREYEQSKREEVRQ